MSTVQQTTATTISTTAALTASQGARAYLDVSKEFHSRSDQEILEASQSWIETLKEEISKTIVEGLTEPKLSETTRHDTAGPGEKKGVYFAYKLADGRCYDTVRSEYFENQRKVDAVKNLSETKIAITRGLNNKRFIVLIGNISQIELRRYRELASNIAIISIAKTENPIHDIEETRKLGEVLLAS